MSNTCGWPTFTLKPQEKWLPPGITVRALHSWRKATPDSPPHLQPLPRAAEKMAALAVLPPAEPPRRVRTQRPSGGQEMQIFQLAGQSPGMDREKKGIFHDWLHVTANAARPSAFEIQFI